MVESSGAAGERKRFDLLYMMADPPSAFKRKLLANTVGVLVTWGLPTWHERQTSRGVRFPYGVILLLPISTCFLRYDE